MDAKALTLSIGGCWYGRYGTAPCPVCQPERRKSQNALTLADGNAGLLLHCKRLGCGFSEILKMAGLWPRDLHRCGEASLAQREEKAKAEVAKRATQAKRVWQESLPISGTPAEAYLRGRGITGPLPRSLRFHPAAWHGPSAKQYPAMIAAVQGAGMAAVHRTYLRSDGSGKALIEPEKLMLGSTKGGAVRLAEGSSRLVVVEGIESGLSLLCGLLDGPAAVWAGLSTSGMRGLRLPAQPGRLTIACDGDQPGRDAAHALAERAHALGWQVSILDPGTERDFNDVLTARGAAL